MALNFELSQRWRQLILKLEVCLSHLVLEATHVSRLFHNTDTDLTLTFFDLSLRALFNSLLFFLRLSFDLSFQHVHHLDLTRQLFVVFVEPRLLNTGFMLPQSTLFFPCFLLESIGNLMFHITMIAAFTLRLVVAAALHLFLGLVGPDLMFEAFSFLGFDLGRFFSDYLAKYGLVGHGRRIEGLAGFRDHDCFHLRKVVVSEFEVVRLVD